MIKSVRIAVVLLSICSCVCGCAHKWVSYAVVDGPSMKTLYEVTSERDTIGPYLLNRDDKSHAFYTCEIACDQSFIRCYDYCSGYKWEVEFPLVVLNHAQWCVGEEVYVGGNRNVWRGGHRAVDLYGCVCLFNLGSPHQELEVVVRSEQRDVCCREIAACDDQYLVFLFGPDNCGEELSSYAIFDPVRHQVVEKKCFTDEASRLRILSRCTRRGDCGRAAFGKYAKKVRDEGCLIYDEHSRLLSKIPADAIEKQFLFLGSQDEEFVRKSRSKKDFVDDIRNRYKSEIVANGRVVFWNRYGSWFVYDINANAIADSGVIKLAANECLIEFVDLNCFLIHTYRLKSLQFLTWDFNDVAYELVFIENGKQKRKPIPGLKWAWKLTDRIYCLDFLG